MRVVTRCCVSCGLMVQICGELTNLKCEKCNESHEADDQDEMYLKGLEEFERIFNSSRPK